MPKKETPAQKIARLEAENKKLKEKQAEQSQLRLKISEKGGVSLYGVHSRFPVTLYADQWERVLDYGDTIRDFIKANREELSFKNDPAPGSGKKVDDGKKGMPGEKFRKQKDEVPV